MTKTVVYNDLEKAAPDIEVHGVAFHDGDSIKVSDEIAGKLAGNRFFDVAGEKPVADQPQEVFQTNEDFSQMNVEDLRAEADKRGIATEGLSKRELRDAIHNHDRLK